MRKKIAILTGIAVMGFSFGTMAVTFAKIIPGVDEPFDPTAYYSSTAISYADSAPSVFALRDIEGGGGQVYDLTRHIKSILFGERFENWLKVEGDKTEIDKKNTDNWANHSISTNISKMLAVIKGLGSEHRDKSGNVIGSSEDWASSSVNSNNKKVLERLQKNHMDNVTSYDLSNQGSNGVFWGPVNSETEAMSRDTISPEKREAWLKKVYSEIGESSENIAADQMQISASNEYALQLSGEAEGKVQALIANTMARCIQTQAVVDINEMYAKLLQLKTINVMDAIDEEQHKNDINGNYYYHVANPYDENAYKYAKENYGIEKIQGHGMPDFK